MQAFQGFCEIYLLVKYVRLKLLHSVITCISYIEYA